MEVLLERRAEDMSQMPGMLELPVLPLEAVMNREPVLRLRHSITNTNFYVQIYAESGLLDELPAAKERMEWAPVARLRELPLTGLARKVLQRLRVMPMLKVRTETI
jgi:A/G-specific adenine glycosylase